MPRIRRTDNGNPNLEAAAFSTSGWEVDGNLDLVHLDFHIDRADLTHLLHAPHVRLVNNAVAKAMAIPVLTDDELHQICGKSPSPGQAVAVMGPGDGLSCAMLVPDGKGRWVASHCEGGHSDFAPVNDLETQVLQLLISKYGHVSRERLISIPGIVELWRCLATIEGDEREAPNIDEIIFQACNADARATRVIEIQTELFAAAASDFALITGARGGVYLTGDWLDLVGDLFEVGIFTQRFYDKGRAFSYLSDIPVFRVTATDPDFVGLSTLFDADFP